MNDTEVIVYFSFLHPINKPNNLFIMKKSDAMKFCSREETHGNAWFLGFTSHKKDASVKTFVKDDGRFDDLLEELKITPIFRLK